jgi:adenine-specific DNA methylase
MRSLHEIIPIKNKIEPDRQGARRHYGVHPYFTRRPYNIVRDYIIHYSSPGEKVLDPFGGSGVTAIEAFLAGRIGIQNDLNPMANFIADGLYFLSKNKEKEVQSILTGALDKVVSPVNDLLNRTNLEIESDWCNYEKQYPLPKNIELPKNSDVKYYYDLFTPKQLICLAIIKSKIEEISNAELKHIALLAWSATLSKINKTFLSAEGRKESRGGSSIFSIYRYKIASQVIELNPLEVFTQRIKNILKAHQEIQAELETSIRKYGSIGKYFSHSINAIDLNLRYDQELDYIFTDPPYGGHISYLDLSTLWNLWLGKNPSEVDFKNELIVGGESKHTEESYIQNLDKSIQTMSATLKDKKFLSVVFQHKNTKYFEAILEAAFQSNCKLVASVPQSSGTVWSMHKKKGLHTVISGEFILTFQKQKSQIMKKSPKGKSFEEVVSDYFYEKKNLDELSEEEVFNDLIVLCWPENLLNELNYSSLDIPKKLQELGFLYDSKHHTWTKLTSSKVQFEIFS